MSADSGMERGISGPEDGKRIISLTTHWTSFSFGSVMKILITYYLCIIRVCQLTELRRGVEILISALGVFGEQDNEGSLIQYSCYGY